MKNYLLNIIAAALLLTGFAGCNDDDFLKETPETFYTIENSFNSSGQVEASVTNMYVHIRYWFEDGSNSATFLKGLGTDVVDRNDFRGAGWSDFSTWTTEHGDIKNVFDAFYQLVGYANTTMLGANASTVAWDDDAKRVQAIAQAKFFRGFAYLKLAELFGGVPLVNELVTTPKYDFVRASREETYAFAIEDLKAALADLPDYPAKAGLVAKGAAAHYISEAYVALATIKNNSAADLDQAISYATQAITLHRLITERFGQRAIVDGGTTKNGVAAYVAEGNAYFDLFQEGNLDYVEGNTEAIWTLQNSYTLYKNFSSIEVIYPRNFGPVLRDMVIKVPDTLKAVSGLDSIVMRDIKPWASNETPYYGGRGASMFSPTKYVTDGVWEGSYADDERNAEINIHRNFKCTNKDPLLEKERIYDSIVPFEKIDHTHAQISMLYPVHTKIIPHDAWGYDDLVDGGNKSGWKHSSIFRDEYAARSAETYLLRAEAYLRKGDNTNAAADINALRNRANAAYKVTGSDVTIELILDERVRELYLEEWRWNTLLRMSTPTDNVAHKQINAHAYMIVDWNKASSLSAGWTLLPFPQKVIDANLDAKIEQNPGWE
jgi:hypothetical protein